MPASNLTSLAPAKGWLNAGKGAWHEDNKLNEDTIVSGSEHTTTHSSLPPPRAVGWFAYYTKIILYI